MKKQVVKTGLNGTKHLIKPNIKFNEDEHTYYNPQSDIYLSGITGMIKKHLFADMYKDVPQSILKKAAERGKLIHQQLEDCDNSGDISLPIQKQWRFCKGRNKIEIFHNEYLVSDEKFYATAIDKIGTWNGLNTLFDVKTTYALHEDYLSWQLSIGEYLLKKHNPKIKIDKYCVIWFKDDEFHIIEIEKRTQKEVESLLKADLAGELFQNPDIEVKECEKTYKKIKEYIDVKNKMDELKELEKQLKSEIEKEFKSKKVKEWNSPTFSITTTKAYVRVGLDTKKLEADHPEIAEEYKKETNVSARINIKLK